MELIAVFVIIMILSSIISSISDTVDKHKQETRDKVAHEVLDHNFNFEKEKEDILEINKSLNAVIERRKRHKLWDTTKKKEMN